MASLNEIAYDLMQHVRANAVDDEDLDLRSIKFWIKNQRALWVKNALSKGKPVPDSFVQYIDAEPVSGSNTNKSTTDDIPQPIFTSCSGAKITRVGAADDTTVDYKFGTYRQSKYYGNGRFNSDFIFSYYRDKKIHIVGDDLSAITSVDIAGVFEDPSDVDGFSETADYPITDSLIPYMKAEIIKLDIAVFLELESDNINNAHNDLN